jgi:photoactive yellow protein
LVELTRALEVGAKKDVPFGGDVRMLTPGDLEEIEKMSPAEIDGLPFGAIRLDREGRVITYNAFEAEAAGFGQQDIIGRRFVELAPCILVREFVAAAARVESGEGVDDVVRYVFPHHGAACVVSVRLYAAPGDDRLWLLVSKRTGSNGASSTNVPDRR